MACGLSKNHVIPYLKQRDETLVVLFAPLIGD